jgi:glucose-1-phosphate thymidylyltransferase
VYDKPLIYYPLSLAILSGSEKIVILTNADDLLNFQRLLDDGSQWNIEIKYATQDNPLGIPNAILCASYQLDQESGLQVFLGDNIFFGAGLGKQLFGEKGEDQTLIFGTYVTNYKDFGVAEMKESGIILELFEKPSVDLSNPLAIPGIYSFPKSIFRRVEKSTVSARGETEVIDVLKEYLSENRLQLKELPRGSAWLDTGTPKALLRAANFVQILQDRQGLLVGSPDEAAWQTNRIDDNQLNELAKLHKNTSYGKQLDRIRRDL